MSERTPASIAMPVSSAKFFMSKIFALPVLTIDKSSHASICLASSTTHDGIRVAAFLVKSIIPWRRQMPEQETLRRAREYQAEGKSPSVQAGEFVREEIHHVREGKHGARSAKQAVAIGLSKAR